MYARLVIPDRATAIYVAFGSAPPGDLKTRMLKAITLARNQLCADCSKLYFEMCPYAMCEFINSIPSSAYALGAFRWGISDNGREHKYYNTRIVEVSPPGVITDEGSVDDKIMVAIRDAARS